MARDPRTYEGLTPLFGNPAIRMVLTRGFASQSRGWFAIVGEGSRQTANCLGRTSATSRPALLGMTMCQSEITSLTFLSNRGIRRIRADSVIVQLLLPNGAV